MARFAVILLNDLSLSPPALATARTAALCDIGTLATQRWC